MVLEGVEVVAVIERLPYSGGLLRNVIQCLEDYNIPLYLSSTVVEVRGKDRLEEVTIARVDDSYRPIPGTEKIFKVDTLVLSVGLIPQVELLWDLVQLDPVSKGVSCSNIGQSSKEWIFSAGNCTVVYDLVDYVTMEGEKAGKYAALYAKGESFESGVPVETGENVGVVFPRRYTSGEDLVLYVRSKKPIEKATLIVGNFERRFEDVMPSEMIRIKIPSQKVMGFERIVVSLKEE